MQSSRRFAASVIMGMFLLSSPIALGSEAKQTVSKKTMDLSCMQLAIDAREIALIDGVSTMHASFQTTYQTRKTSLHAAWSISDAKQRRDAVKNAWSTFRTSKKKLLATWNSSRKGTWATFRNAAKACSIDASSMSTETSGMASE